ncbi:MAG: hypothetical protein KDI36_16485, partial [Pseudomonadales bacterium]|nr:hypothetical protein [Pseudomonadales bacterium]
MSDPRRETALSHLLINQGRSAKMSAVCEIGDFGYLNIRVRPTDTQGQKKLEEISGLTVPAAPNTYSSAGRGTETRRLLWLGPDEFLCLLPHATLTSAVASLEASAESAMGITDVSSGYTLLTLTSPFANEIVRSACP